MHSSYRYTPFAAAFDSKSARQLAEAYKEVGPCPKQKRLSICVLGET